VGLIGGLLWQAALGGGCCGLSCCYEHMCGLLCVKVVLQCARPVSCSCGMLTLWRLLRTAAEITKMLAVGKIAEMLAAHSCLQAYAITNNVLLSGRLVDPQTRPNQTSLGVHSSSQVMLSSTLVGGASPPTPMHQMPVPVSSSAQQWLQTAW